MFDPASNDPELTDAVPASRMSIGPVAVGATPVSRSSFGRLEVTSARTPSAQAWSSGHERSRIVEPPGPGSRSVRYAPAFVPLKQACQPAVEAIVPLEKTRLLPLTAALSFAPDVVIENRFGTRTETVPLVDPFAATQKRANARRVRTGASDRGLPPRTVYVRTIVRRLPLNRRGNWIVIGRSSRPHRPASLRARARSRPP